MKKAKKANKKEEQELETTPQISSHPHLKAKQSLSK